MGRRKKNKKSKILKIIYLVCIIAVFIAGLYYENGYTDVNSFVNDMANGFIRVSETIVGDVTNTLKNNEQETSDSTETTESKIVYGTLQMHTIDVGQRR